MDILYPNMILLNQILMRLTRFHTNRSSLTDRSRDHFVVVRHLHGVHGFPERPRLIMPLYLPPNRQQFLVRGQCITVALPTVLSIEFIFGPPRLLHALY